MEPDFTQFVLGLPEVTAIVGSRVGWDRLPAHMGALPCLILTTIDGAKGYALDGPVNVGEALIQADVWAETGADAIAGRDAIRAALECYRGETGSTRWRGIFVEGWRSLTRQDLGGVSGLYGQSIDLRIRWSRVP